MADLVDLTQGPDSEDEDLKLAIAMSLSEQNGNITTPKPSQPTNTGISGLDRKGMEQERLARKRKRDDETISPPPLSRRPKPAPKSNTSTKPMASKPSTQPQSSSSPSTPPLEYPNGTIKRTWVSSHPATSQDITFTSLINATQLQSALLSSYTWDFDWLFPHFSLQRTSFLLVLHAHTPQHRHLLESDFADIPNVRLCFPSTEGLIHCMHSKLLLLFYATHCRVVVPTANLTAYDWGAQGGIMENSVFVIDLPLRIDADTATDGEPSDSFPAFHTALREFLLAQDVPADVLARLARFDFGATARENIGFVHTIGGAHADERVWRGTGHCGLGRTVTEMGLAVRDGEAVEIDFVTSSVGSLTEEFLRGMYLAVVGDDGMGELGIRLGEKEKGKKKKKKSRIPIKQGIQGFFGAHGSVDIEPQEDEDEDEGASDIAAPAAATSLARRDAWRSAFRVFFPSHATVASSIGGTAAAGTICFQRRWWENVAKFPRANMRDCVSVRKGVLMHNKIMFVRYTGTAKRKRREHVGWVYVGSANLSESAWGRLVMDRSKNGNKDEGVHVKLNCRNWECGVVMSVAASALGQSGVVEKGELGIFESLLPVPMEYPGRAYVENGGMEPWFFGKEGVAA